jgi:D-alanyl-D-alanine carboxypeptidase
MIKAYIPLPLPPQKRTRKNSFIKRWLYLIAAGILSGGLCFAINHGQICLEDYMYAQISQPINDIVLAKMPPKQELSLDAKAALSRRIGATGRDKTIYQKNADQVLPIASITKLMTAVVVLETPELYDLQRSATTTLEASFQEDVPVFGNLIVGQRYTVQELLGLMLFYSSNDAAYSLSEIMGVKEFVAAMNKKAFDLELAETEFCNPTGLDMENGNTNQSTPADLLALTEYILKNHPEIFSMTTTAGPYRTENGIFSLDLWEGQSLIGGKTGYTEKAGGCMIVIVGEQTGRYYIDILLGAASPKTRVAQMQKLINFTNNI